MKALLPVALLAAFAAGCGDERTPDAVEPAAPAQSAPAPATPAPRPAASSPDDADDQASLDGYGDLKFGIAADAMEPAWGGELKEIGKDANPDCYFMTPAWVEVPAELSFMVGEGRFVRYGSTSSRLAAPGGGKVGMETGELQALYGNALQASPHKYVEGGQYLSTGDASGKLVFETDADGIVTEWRVGVPPQIDYVEGCS